MTLEELLNKLIEKGWKPFGIYGNWELEWERICIEEQTNTNEYYNKAYYINVDYVEFNWLCDEDKNFSDKFSLRDIVSRESWLWQFCVENGMVFIPKWEIPYVERNYIFDYECYEVSEFKYWLMVWALLNEDELEQFLLDNIKIEW